MDSDNMLDALLDQAFVAVMSADYAALEAIDARIDAALAQGGPIRDQAQLLRLQRKAERNAICLQSAARGIRSAVRRLQEVRRAATGLATYDGKGRRVEIAGQGRLSARF
jgi:hypothetical protein